jgi:splicing factor 3B subunit 3
MANQMQADLTLLDLPLKRSGAIIASVMGEFTAPGAQEIVVLRPGGLIELLRIETEEAARPAGDDSDEEEELSTGIKLVNRTETQSVLRSLEAVRLSGSKRDVLAVGADGGRLTVLDFEPCGSGGQPSLLHCPAFGRTGCHRGMPGQYLAVDPKGRAVLVGAAEKRKLVYVLNRDASGRPTIASPLEAHRSRTICFGTVGLDNGYDNPIFASLEYQYPEIEDGAAGAGPSTIMEKQLAYYELDLGLNHVSRRWAVPAQRTAACLAALPGGTDGPGGVLVGGEDWIEYLHEGMTGGSSPHDGMDVDGDRKAGKVICALPRRALHPAGKGVLVTQITVHRQKKKYKFFALAQTEYGDVYKVTVRLDAKDKTRVVGLTVSLFDTLPVANGLNVSKLGMLFVPAEFGDHALYQFLRIDVDDSAPTCTSEEATAAFLGQEEVTDEATYFADPAHATAAAAGAAFTPTSLRNLRRLVSADSLAPITDVIVGELAGNEVSPQIYALCGRGPRSSLRTLRHGAAVTELAVSDLPGVPGAIFTVADNSESAAGTGRRMDKYIVVSFADASLVLAIGDTVEEIGEGSGFVTNVPTLACSALSGGGIVQVHPGGVRHINVEKGQAKQWHCPGLKRIETASANESQVIIAFAGGEVIYFELDPQSGNLTEAATKDMGADVCCLDVGTIQKGRSRGLFAAVGFRDQTVRIVSLAPGSLLAQKSSSALRALPHGTTLQYVGGEDNAAISDLILSVGLDDGSSLRVGVDPVTGSISGSPARRFLGARPVSVSRVTVGSSPASLLLSSRPWISRPDPATGRHVMAPLSYLPLDHGCAFSSATIREGIVATAGSTLRILSVEAEGSGLGTEDEAFNAKSADLRYTPRQMCLLSTGGGAAPQKQEDRKIVLAVVESDYNDYGLEEKSAMGFDATGGLGKMMKKESKKEDGDAMDMDESDDEEGKEEKKQDDGDDDDEEDDEDEIQAITTPIRGPFPAEPGHWGSCVRLVDPSDSCATLDCVEMGRNEAALCCSSVRFHTRGGEALLAVGTVTSMTMHPLTQSESHVLLYRVIDGERLQLLHRTKIDEGPVLAMSHFQGRLLVGIGSTLRLYEMGKRQLLRKCELRGLPSKVKTLQTAGDRAFVGDMMQSMQIVRYDSVANRLVLVANDRNPRPVTCQELLDLNTVAVGDKFGNICVLRLPRGADAGAVDISGNRALWDASREDATPKLDMLCNYHVGEIVTGITRASLVAGGAESLIYVTVSGRIGALVPFMSRDDIEFFTLLEGCMRTDAPRPTGREPQAYRSYYAPVKHVVDGELCESFSKLSYELQKKIAEKLDRTIDEVVKNLERIRHSLL